MPSHHIAHTGTVIQKSDEKALDLVILLRTLCPHIVTKSLFFFLLFLSYIMDVSTSSIQSAVNNARSLLAYGKISEDVLGLVSIVAVLAG